mgnify:CR=1 FL=1
MANALGYVSETKAGPKVEPVVSTAQARPILDIQHATVYRGDTCVFSDFSFMLREGEHAAIVGPNGAGKSTSCNTEKTDSNTGFRTDQAN